MANTTPQVRHGLLFDQQAVGDSQIAVGSRDWWTWLEANHGGVFRFLHPAGCFSARRERRRGGWYWYAYLKRGGELHKSYLGRSENLTAERLEAVAQSLARRADGAAAPSSSPNTDRKGGLLSQPTRLIGREREIAALAGLLGDPDTRLVTLIGTGGVGKTSIALAVATQLLAHFVDGAWFIDLAAINDPGLVAPTIATGLGVRQTARQPVYESLAEHLGRRRVLLVLDNFEQVLAGALVVADLLASCPGLVVLATSREPLHLRWERHWPVPPLELPALDGRPAVDTLASSPAVALFVERAQAVSPDFALHASNASTVAQICIRLDGLPLAVELAAARVKVLSPALILARLERRLDLAGQDAQDCPPRHRTLRAAIAWSYDLLNDGLQTVFRRLSVFVGGCTVDAAMAICLPGAGTEGERCILDALASLIDKQLVRHEVQPDGTSRYRMLETIREYAQEQLAASGEANDVRRIHATYYLAITQEAAEDQSPRANVLANGLDWELDNIRATLRWSLEAGDIALGLRLIELLTGRWAMLGLHREGREWLASLLARTPELTPERAGGLIAAAYLALRQGDYGVATALLDEALTLVTPLGDARLGARIWMYQGMIAHALGEPSRAMALYQEGLGLLRAAGEKRGMTGLLRNLADLAYEQRALERARALYEETLALARGAHNEHDEAYALRGLAHVARVMGDLRRATDLYSESLLLCRRMEDRRCITFCIEGLACVASRAGVAERATVLFGSAQSLRDTIGVALPPAERADHEREVAAVRAVLDDLHFSALWQRGAAMELEEAVRHALVPMPLEDTGGSRKPAACLPGIALTRREREVAEMIVSGLNNREIAEALVIAEGTAERHVSNILRKLGFSSRTQIAVWATGQGLVPALSA